MTLLALLGVVLVLFLAAVLVTREGATMAPAAQDAADVALPVGPFTPEDVRALRFGMAPRGYRMSEVDRVLDRLVDELADRDRRIAELGGAAAPTAPALVSAPAAVAEAAPAPPRPDPLADPLPSGGVHSGGDLPPGARH